MTTTEELYVKCDYRGCKGNLQYLGSRYELIINGERTLVDLWRCPVCKHIDRDINQVDYLNEVKTPSII